MKSYDDLPDDAALSALEQRLRALTPTMTDASVTDAAYEAGRRDAETQLRAAAHEQARREVRGRLFVHRLATAAALAVAVTLGLITALDRDPADEASAMLAQGQDVVEAEEPAAQQDPTFITVENQDTPPADRQGVAVLRLVSFWLMGDSTRALEPLDRTRSPYSYAALRSTVLTDDAVRLDRLPRSSPGASGAGDFRDDAPPTAGNLLREVATWDL